MEGGQGDAGMTPVLLEHGPTDLASIAMNLEGLDILLEHRTFKFDPAIETLATGHLNWLKLDRKMGSACSLSGKVMCRWAMATSIWT